MTDIEKLKQIKEYFDGLALYFKDQTKEYKHPEDIDPKDFVVCLPEGRYADTDKSDNSSK